MNILALHGLRETPTTSALISALRGNNVIAPPIDPWHPFDTWEGIMRMVGEKKPDLTIGFSLGGFFASTLPLDCHFILINPALDFIGMLKERRQPREGLIKEYELLPTPPLSNVTGIFATGDLKIGMRGLRVFKERYPKGEVRLIPGGHNLTEEEFKKESGF